MNTVTATFANLDVKLFDQYMEDARFLGLRLVSFRGEDSRYLDLTLRGNYEMIKTFTNWINNASNWTAEALEDAAIMAAAEYYAGEQE